MAQAAATYITPDTRASNDNQKPRGCRWTALILAMRSVGPESEALAWAGRKAGLTVERFCEIILQYAGTK